MKKKIKDNNYHWRPILNIFKIYKSDVNKINLRKTKIFKKTFHFCKISESILKKKQLKYTAHIFYQIIQWYKKNNYKKYFKFKFLALTNFFFKNWYQAFLCSLNTCSSIFYYKLDFLNFYDNMMFNYFFYNTGLYDVEIILYLFIIEFTDFFHIDY